MANKELLIFNKGREKRAREVFLRLPRRLFLISSKHKGKRMNCVHVLARKFGADERNAVAVAHCVTLDEVFEARHNAKGHGSASARVQHHSLRSGLLPRSLANVDAKEPMRLGLSQLYDITVADCPAHHVNRLQLVAFLLQHLLVLQLPQVHVGRPVAVLPHVGRVLQQRPIVGRGAHFEHELA